MRNTLHRRNRAVTGLGMGALILFILIPFAARGQERPTRPPQGVLPASVQRDGPPANRPADDPGPAPGPGLYYVPGEYIPQNGEIVWRPGFWAEEQEGWVWSPARWVRSSNGWSFREGFWAPDDLSWPPTAPVAAERTEARIDRETQVAGNIVNETQVVAQAPAVTTRTVTIMPSPIVTTYATPISYGYLSGTGFGGIGAVTPNIFVSGVGLSPFGFGGGFPVVGPGFGGFGPVFPGYGGWGGGGGGWGWRGGFGFGRGWGWGGGFRRFGWW